MQEEFNQLCKRGKDLIIVAIYLSRPENKGLVNERLYENIGNEIKEIITQQDAMQQDLHRVLYGR